jgi:hypothetical protein
MALSIYYSIPPPITPLYLFSLELQTHISEERGVSGEGTELQTPNSSNP